MKVKLVSFGEIDIEGTRYDHDVVICAGRVERRKKGPSKTYRGEFGHTPLSADENIPWGGDTLFIGTGAYGGLPITKDVFAEAQRKGVEIVSGPTDQICELLRKYKPADVNAVLHVTC